MEKRVLSIVLALILAVTLLPMSAVAASPTPTKYNDGGGDGSKDDPYLIHNVTQLEDLANEVNKNKEKMSGKYFKLIEDIKEGFTTPIGKPGVTYNGAYYVADPTNYKFCGCFDGDGHTINLKMDNGDTYMGLFGIIGTGGIVKNVTVTGTVKGNSKRVPDATYDGKNYVGGICAFSNGTIINCTNNASVAGIEHVGGICGYNAKAAKELIINCTNNGNVTGSTYVGGICGSNESLIFNCVNNGVIKSTDNTEGQTGGVCGHQNVNGNFKYNPDSTEYADSVGILNCVNNGSVSGGKEIGAVCGHAENGVINCYHNMDKVNGLYSIGAFADLFLGRRDIKKNSTDETLLVNKSTGTKLDGIKRIYTFGFKPSGATTADKAVESLNALLTNDKATSLDSMLSGSGVSSSDLVQWDKGADGLPKLVFGYTIEYNSKGGSEITSLIGQTAIPNELPKSTKAGFEFTGWYTDETCDHAAVTGSAISEDTTLFAGWVAHEFIYKASDSAIIATCSHSACDLPNDHKAVLTLTSSAVSFSYDSNPHGVGFAVGEEDLWELATGKDAPTIEYFLPDGATSTTPDNSGAASVGLAPKNPGSYIAKITCEGQTASLEFAINKASISPVVSITGWTYGDSANDPSVSGNTDNGEVVYQYKQKDEDDASYTTVVPTNAGIYTVKVIVSETELYGSGCVTTNFAIAQKEIIVGGIQAENKVYDGSTTATLVYTDMNITGTVGDETISATAIGTFVDKKVGSNKTVNITAITPTDINGQDFAKNYKVSNESQTSTTASITAKPVTAKWTNTTKTYNASSQSPTVELIGVGNGDNLSLIGAERTDAKSYLITTSALSGSDKDNYILTNPNVNFVIGKAPVSFTVTNNSHQHDDTAKQATVTASPDVDFTVIYKNKKGEIVASPTDAEDYDIFVKINNENYRHENTATGAERRVGTLTIYKNNPPTTYIIDFDGGDDVTGSTTSISAIKANDVVKLPANEFTKSGWTFVGWKYKNKLYKVGERFVQPASDVVFEAQWTQDVYSVEGTVTDHAGDPQKDTIVTLMSGATQIGQKTTDEAGEFSFSDVLSGLYNLVIAYDGVTVTDAIRIEDASCDDLSVSLPKGRTNSIVEVAPGTPDVIVDGLQDSFEVSDEGNYKPADETIVLGGGSVEFKLAVSENSNPDEDKKEALSHKSSNEFLLLDMDLSKTTIDYLNNTTVETLYASDQLLEVVIPIPAELQGKDSYLLYRFHSPDGTPEREELTALKQLSGTGIPTEEGYRISADKTTITVYTKSFSLYAVSYEKVSSGGAPIYMITGNDTENGKLTLNTKYAYFGEIVTITVEPDAGYILDALVAKDINGNEIALTKVSDAKYTFSMPALNITVSADFKKGPCPQDETCVYAHFTDADPKAWYHDGVHYCVENGIMEGIAEHTFDPSGPLSRGMIVTMLWRMEGKPSTDYEMTFTDVNVDAWYTEAVRWAESVGVVEGYSDEIYGPKDNVTREQLAAILMRYANFKGIDVSERADLSKFTDAEKVSGWALENVKWANAVGIIEGRSETTIAPKDDSSRAEAACMVQRFCENILKTQQ